MNRFRFVNSPDISKIIYEVEGIDRTNYNEKIMFYLAVDKKDTPKPSFVKIEFLSKDDPLPEEITYDYEDFVIIKRLISYDDFIKILENIEKQKEIGIRSLKDCIVKIDGWDKMFISSNQPWGYIIPEFPTLYFQGRINQQISGIIPQEVLCAKDTPPYPNGSSAMAHIFDLRVQWIQERLFLIMIPDFRARIKKVTISNNKIQTEIDARYVSETDLFCQFYIAGNNKTITNPRVEIKNKIASLNFQKDLEHSLVLLMTKKGEILDKKEFSMTYLQGDSSVVVEIPSYSLMEMIANGEGKHIEFKSRLDNPEPFITSVVSFANTEGGRIFIGVNDYGEITGIEDPDAIKTKISDWIAQYCDPRIDVKMNYSSDLNVVLVEVPSGTGKPYFLKTGGCFIRHGSTDRQATRIEQEYMKKSTDDKIEWV